MKLYLNANTDQVYSALTNNAITSFSNTIEKLQHKTFSFMSDNFVLLTKGILPKELRHWKTDDVFFPVTLEIDFSNGVNIPAFIITKNDDGNVELSSELTNLKEAPENTVAAFVCGEIPLAYLSAIIFENEENKVRFRKPSPDLWFPEEIYATMDDSYSFADQGLTVEIVCDLSKCVDESLAIEDKISIVATVNKRNRFKAMAYLAIRETKKWQMDNLKSNIDFYVIDLLDDHQGEQGLLYKAFSDHLSSLNSENADIPTIGNIGEKENVILGTTELTLDKAVISEVIKWFYTFDKETVTIDRESIEHIKATVIKSTGCGKATDLFDVVAEFLTSTYMNPEKALAKLEGHPVLKALMKFLDSSDNDAFMNRGCEDLNQYERRYAYMMFAALKGMRFVEREWKSNFALEQRLEELAVSKFSNAMMISSIPSVDDVKLCSENKSVYGLNFVCSYWMGRESTLDILTKPENTDKLQRFYDFISADKTLKMEKLECFESPCVITVTCGDYSEQISVTNIEELKKEIKNAKWISAINKAVPKRTALDIFLKKYVLNNVWYTAVFEKYAEEIQNICRG